MCFLWEGESLDDGLLIRTITSLVYVMQGFHEKFIPTVKGRTVEGRCGKVCPGKGRGTAGAPLGKHINALTVSNDKSINS